MMNEKFVKTSVMNKKIDPKVVMELSTFRIGGWHNFTSQQPKFIGRIY